MTHGAPDGVMRVQVAVTIAGEPVVPEPATEAAAGAEGQYSGTDTTFQTVATWTVTADRVGELKEITLLSDNYEKTIFQITIGTVTWSTSFAPQAAVPLIFEDLKLAAAAVVTVECKSSDGTSITVDAVITGKEIFT